MVGRELRKPLLRSLWTPVIGDTQISFSRRSTLDRFVPIHFLPVGARSVRIEGVGNPMETPSNPMHFIFREVEV